MFEEEYILPTLEDTQDGDSMIGDNNLTNLPQIVADDSENLVKINYGQIHGGFVANESLWDLILHQLKLQYPPDFYNVAIHNINWLRIKLDQENSIVLFINGQNIKIGKFGMYELLDESTLIEYENNPMYFLSNCDGFIDYAVEFELELISSYSNGSDIVNVEEIGTFFDYRLTINNPVCGEEVLNSGKLELYQFNVVDNTVTKVWKVKSTHISAAKGDCFGLLRTDNETWDQFVIPYHGTWRFSATANLINDIKYLGKKLESLGYRPVNNLSIPNGYYAVDTTIYPTLAAISSPVIGAVYQVINPYNESSWLLYTDMVQQIYPTESIPSVFLGYYYDGLKFIPLLKDGILPILGKPTILIEFIFEMVTYPLD